MFLIIIWVNTNKVNPEYFVKIDQMCEEAIHSETWTEFVCKFSLASVLATIFLTVKPVNKEVDCKHKHHYVSWLVSKPYEEMHAWYDFTQLNFKWNR